MPMPSDDLEVHVASSMDYGADATGFMERVYWETVGMWDGEVSW